jgi:hypothetical protein
MTKSKTKEVVHETLEEVSVEEIKSDTPEVVVEVQEDLPPHVDVKLDVIKTKKSLGKVSGTISNCNALRLREGANIKTKELAIIPVGAKVSINLDNSTESFYEVTYIKDDVKLLGFCLKEFITVG